MTDRWRRPYRPGLFTVFAGPFVAFGIGFLGLATWQILSSARPAMLDPPPALAGVWLFMGAWLAFAWRMLSTGVYISTRGLRIRNFTSTKTLDWREVDRIYLDDLRVPVFGTWPTRARAIWIKPKDGSAIQTFLNDQSAEFFGRRRTFQYVYEQLVRAHHEAT
jgi:hypothetical protein